MRAKGLSALLLSVTLNKVDYDCDCDCDCDYDYDYDCDCDCDYHYDYHYCFILNKFVFLHNLFRVFWGLSENDLWPTTS